MEEREPTLSGLYRMPLTGRFFAIKMLNFHEKQQRNRRTKHRQTKDKIVLH